MTDIVERLRVSRDKDVQIGPLLDAEREEAADEIERQAKSIEEAMTQLAWKDDEIERLRGLLLRVEAMGYFTPSWDSSSEHRAICKEWKRVHETLGGSDEH